jgi:hypothetical protein
VKLVAIADNLYLNVLERGGEGRGGERRRGGHTLRE